MNVASPLPTLEVEDVCLFNGRLEIRRFCRITPYTICCTLLDVMSGRLTRPSLHFFGALEYEEASGDDANPGPERSGRQLAISGKSLTLPK
jgi:hypothetical protein